MFIRKVTMLSILLFISYLSSSNSVKSEVVVNETKYDFNEVKVQLKELDLLFAKIPDNTSSNYSIELSTSKNESITKIYSILNYYGLSDMQIAGLMGHWERESSNDPTVIEGIYDEPFRVGPRTLNAINDITNYTYALRKGKSLKWYQVNSNIAVCGLGLGQFTGSRGLEMMNKSKELNEDLFTVEFQLAVDINTLVRKDPDSGIIRRWYDTLKLQNLSDIKEMVYYCTRCHGGADPYGKVSTTMQKRVEAGKYYYNLITDGIEIDNEAINKFIEITNRLKGMKIEGGEEFNNE